MIRVASAPDQRGVAFVKAVTQCGELRRDVTSRDGRRRHERAADASLA
jgi:hypothetical protein